MKDEFEKLRKNLCSWDKTEKLTSKEWDKVSQKTTVVLMSGGESSRFREVVGSANVNKNAFQLPNGDTMMEMTVRMYRDAGIKKFVALVRENAESIIEVLGNGEKLGVQVEYSTDPNPPAGRGGAMRKAYETDKFDNSHYIIVHNPDDLILDFEGNFAKHILEGHINSEKQGAKASYVVCDGASLPGSAMHIKNGQVVETEYGPFVPIPFHIGTTIFSPGLKDSFIKEFDYSVKADFETTMLPKMAKEGKLFAVGIPVKNWYPVNNLKNYKQLLAKLGLN